MRPFLVACIAIACAAIAPRVGAQETVNADAAVPFAPMAHVERAGSGSAEMILIPDLWCDWTVWDAFMARNANRYAMVAVTLPGMCGTAPPATPQRSVLVEDDRILTPWLDNAVHAVLDVIKREELDRPLVVGHGLGALIGFRLSAEHPELIGGHVAIDGAPSTLMYTKPLPISERTDIVRTRLLRTLQGMDDSRWEARLREHVSSGVTDPERADELLTRMAQTNHEVGSRYFLEFYGADETDAIRDCFTPTLVVAAAGDVPTVRVRGTSRLHQTWYAHLEGLRDLELIFVPTSRHFVMDDAPARLDTEIASFVDRVGQI